MTTDKQPIKGLKDLETALALKRICNYLVKIGWHHDPDDDEWGAELKLAVARSKRHKSDVEKLSELDTELDWGQTKKKVGESTYVITGGGDFNPWYQGDLTLNELVDSIKDLADILESIEPLDGETTEFLHYYHFLGVKLISAQSLKKAPVKAILFENLHPKIKQHCTSRYKNKNYSDAIFTAYKVVFNELKELTGIKHLDGKRLAEKIFALENPVIKLNNLQSESEQNEQKGFMLLLSGAYMGIRDPKAHDLVEQVNEYRTLEYLSFASLLLTRIDERKELDISALQKNPKTNRPLSHQNSTQEELPYVYIQGSFGGNGHIMGFRACETYNLSDKFVFIEKIKVIDVVMPFNNTLIEAGKSIRHSGVDGLFYPTSNDSKQTIDIYFHSRNKERFISRHQLKFQKRTDGRFNIIGIDEPTISKL